MGTPDYIVELRKKPCQCVRCADCDGFGRIDDPFDYSGTYPRTCDGCNGSGIVEACDRCMELDELEHDGY